MLVMANNVGRLFEGLHRRLCRAVFTWTRCFVSTLARFRIPPSLDLGLNRKPAACLPPPARIGRLAL